MNWKMSNEFILTSENYYSCEANRHYMSVSQYKSFAGTLGRTGCEFEAMEELDGQWHKSPSTAMLIGSYIDSYVEGTLDKFKEEHPELFTAKGELKATYKKAEQVIARIERDPFFMSTLAGEKQVIMTGELFGAKWKIKMDSYLPGTAIVDLKVVSSLTEMKWVKDHGYTDFIRYWNYDIQGAVYQEIVRQNTGLKLPFYISGVSKEEEPDIRVIQIEQNFLDEALAAVEANMPRIIQLRNGEVEPDRCEMCDCCRHHRVLTAPISLSMLNASI